MLFTCCDNSLVGASIKPIGPSPSFNSGWSIMCTNIGHMNANVLPLPVLAIPKINDLSE